MTRLPLLLVLLAMISHLEAAEKKMIPRYNRLTNKWVAYPAATIHDIQFVAPESLAAAEALGGTYIGPRWTVQASPLTHYDALQVAHPDTVVGTALVIMPSAAGSPHVGISFTQHGWTMLLHDTAPNSNQWGGILVRVGAGFKTTDGSPDTAQARTDGFNNVERGDIITITGWIEEFPTDGHINTTTQFRPYPGIPIDILSSNNPLPPPTLLPTTAFYSGGYPGGDVKFTTGEAYECSLVKLLHLNVFDYVNTARGTWSMKDASGNYIADLDASHYFTFGNESPLIKGDTSFHMPVLGAVVDTIVGTMLSNSGGENPRGFRICPLYPGDVKLGISIPTVITHRRFPVIPKSTDTVLVHGVVRKTTGGYPISRAVLLFSVDNGPWVGDTMSMISVDSNYEGKVLDIDGQPFPVNSSIRYFLKGIDDHGISQILANSSSTFPNDTSKGFFFYTVLDRPLTIHDVQYTPYPNGRSAYVGGVTSLSGVVTASSHEIGATPLNSGGTSSWYIQNGSAPWSGIWVVKDTVNLLPLDSLKLGDSVTVTGTIQEQFDVTRIFDSVVVINAHNRPLPAPITVATGTFGNRGNGDLIAEQYEGVLIRVVGSTVTNFAATFADSTEWEITDGGVGPMIIRRDGVNSYGNRESDTSTSGSTRIIHNGDRIDTLTGIGMFSFSRDKLVPRTNADFVAGEPYQYNSSWNITSVGRRQIPSANYRVDSLFPGRISPAFGFNGSYYVSPTLRPASGYWVKFAAGKTIRQLGAKLTLDTVHVVSGWNLVGTIGSPILTSSITTNSGNHLSKFFEYVAGYNVVTTLTPSKGYWVKADLDGYFLESSSFNIPKMPEPSIANFNSIKLTDRDGNSQTLYFGQDAKREIALRDYDLPPPGPVEGFSVSWNTGRIVETYPAVVRDGRNFVIDLKADNGPVSVSWSIVKRDAKHFTLTDAENGKKMKPVDLSASGSIASLKSGINKLILRVDGGAPIPMEYSLGQNYPNPFNPTTQFTVGLPEAGRLEIAVYNVLGQKVATLVDEVRDPGYQTVLWNSTAQDGHAVSSGVYFVRMNADKFTAVRKIMLMK
ncbi:MAG: T9SS type A sorting domain-containing protein [Ignavibacteria bacterium]|nr:MAG: T9SS type A sorting domain-containing protein [Ignavibacteria bacterium]